MKVIELVAMIDHASLKAYADAEDRRKLCDGSRENGFATIGAGAKRIGISAGLKDLAEFDGVEA